MTDDLETLTIDAQLRFPRIADLPAPCRCQLMSKGRQAMLDALGVGGSKPEVCRRAKLDARRTPMIEAAERDLCEGPFSDFFYWLYDQLRGQREGVT